MTNRKICPKCDYFRFCLSNEASGESIGNYFAGSVLALVDRVDFDTGEIRSTAAGRRNGRRPRTVAATRPGGPPRFQYRAVSGSLFCAWPNRWVRPTWPSSTRRGWQGGRREEALMSRTLADLTRQDRRASRAGRRAARTRPAADSRRSPRIQYRGIRGTYFAAGPIAGDDRCDTDRRNLVGRPRATKPLSAGTSWI